MSQTLDALGDVRGKRVLVRSDLNVPLDGAGGTPRITDDGRVLPNFVGQAMRGEALTVFGEGKQTRSFCYVSDLVDGIYRLLQTDYHMPVNLGNPGEFTIRQLAELVIELTGSKSKLVYHALPPDDPKQRQPDIAKAKAELGWDVTVPLRAGLGKTIDYFRELVGG